MSPEEIEHLSKMIAEGLAVTAVKYLDETAKRSTEISIASAIKIVKKARDRLDAVMALEAAAERIKTDPPMGLDPADRDFIAKLGKSIADAITAAHAASEDGTCLGVTS